MQLLDDEDPVELVSEHKKEDPSNLQTVEKVTLPHGMCAVRKSLYLYVTNASN